MPSPPRAQMPLSWRGPLLGASSAAICVALLWGFSVDDALISARMAHHLASGVGYRFELSGPAVDAVTPLGFAHVLAPFARSGPLAAFRAARVLGVLGWLGGAALLGAWVEMGGARRLRFLPLVLLAFCAPLGAWPSSGMETGLVTGLAVLALAEHRLAPLAAGLAAGWRPELLPWAMTLSIGGAFVRTGRPAPAVGALGLALLPAIVVAVARQLAFGSAMPLAVLAKPARLDDGLTYAWGALLFTGLPLLAVAPRGLGSLDRHARVILVAALVHFGSLILAGGDWMPLYRLAVPVLPGFVLIGARLAEHTAAWATLLRQLAALAACLVLGIALGPTSRHVWQQRSALMAEARVALAGAERVATLDAGWVGVVHPGPVVDLAGVTDPRIAGLPGGHTSKQLSSGLLDAREVDAVVALWDDARGGWFRLNDARIAKRAVELGFVRKAELPLAGSHYRYVVLRR
jgi:hypothetical protein